MVTGIECPYCNKPMSLTMGNPVFSYWLCENCNKEFAYNTFWETITTEADSKLSAKKNGRKSSLMFFKKKKIYRVEYKDNWNDYGCTIVKAFDKADAWKKTRRQRYSGSPYQANICINITELNDA